jgi:uncharacterized protein (TIGR03382 family)
MRVAMLACVLAACVDRPLATPDAAVDAGDIPVACDGALCATTNGSTCNASTSDPATLAGVLVALASLRLRRYRR